MAGREGWRSYEVPRSSVSAGAVIRWGQRNLAPDADGRLVGVVWRDKGGRTHHAVYAKNFESGKERSWRVSERDYRRVMDWAHRRYDGTMILVMES